MATPPKKQTSPGVSTLASDVLAKRIKPTEAQIATLAAAALSNDETKGQGRKPTAAPKPASKTAAPKAATKVAPKPKPAAKKK